MLWSRSRKGRGWIRTSYLILIRDVRLPSPERGDLLAIFSTGAYCASMASNYNKLPFLPVVMTNQGREKGQHRLVVRRQTYQDLISRDI